MATRKEYSGYLEPALPLIYDLAEKNVPIPAIAEAVYDVAGVRSRFLRPPFLEAEDRAATIRSMSHIIRRQILRIPPKRKRREDDWLAVWSQTYGG